MAGSLTARRGADWRWLAGYDYEEHKFSAVRGSVPPDPFPPDRTLGYPWIGFASIEDRFDKTVNVDRIYRTEDVDLGRAVRRCVSAGRIPHSAAIQQQPDRVRHATIATACVSGDKHLLFYGASLRGYWNFDSNESEQVMGARVSRHSASNRAGASVWPARCKA